MKQHNPDPNLDDEEEILLDEDTVEEISNEYAESLELLKNKCLDFEDKYKRALADYQNLEHRVQIERTTYIKTANRWLIESLLEPIDFMEKATEHIDDKGLKMVTARFYQVLSEEGLKEIDALGKMFDEKTMDAIDTAEGEENKVMKVVSKGFMLHDQVIRHAKVVVGKGK